MNHIGVRMVSQLISIPGWDSKSRTISEWPSFEAKSNGVQLGIGMQFQKWFKVEIWWNNEIEIVWMTLVLKCLCSWFQYLVVIIKVEQFQYDLLLKQKSKEYN